MTSARSERLLWNEPVERMSRDAMRALQLQRLKEQVAYNYANSEFYRAKFDSVGMKPGDVRSFDDFARVPLMTKDEHRQAQAESLTRYGDPLRILNCAQIDKVVRINSTSGTTGMPPLYALTANDVAVVNEMHARKYWRAGIRPGHIMLQALSLSMFTGGLPLSQGIMHMAACVVPVGVEGRHPARARTHRDATSPGDHRNALIRDVPDRGGAQARGEAGFCPRFAMVLLRGRA